MKRFWASLRKSFFAGLVVVVPVAASIGILFWLFTTVTNWLLPAALRSGQQQFFYRTLALFVFVFLVTAVGWVTRLVVGRRLVTTTEKIIARVPLLNRIYAFVKDVSNTMFSGQKSAFQRVVLVEFPRPGSYAIGFV